MQSFDTGLQPDACCCAKMVTPQKNFINSNVVGRQSFQSSSTSHRRVADPEPQERLSINVLTEILFTSAGKFISLSSMAGKACCSLCNFDAHKAQLSRQCDLATKCRMRSKLLQTINRKSSTVLLTNKPNETSNCNSDDRSD